MSVSQRLPALQRVLNAFERFPLAAQFQKRFALEVEQVLFADRRLVRERTSREDVRERPADDLIVIGNAPGAPREVDAELEGRTQRFAADGNGRSRRRTLIPLARALERELLRIGDQAVAIHRDAVGFAQKTELPRVLGARRHGREADGLENRLHERRSEEHTSELQSHSFISYAVFCLKKKKQQNNSLSPLLPHPPPAPLAHHSDT